MIPFTDRTLQLLQYATLPFLEARRLQEDLADEVAQGSQPPTLLLLEHLHTFTFERRGHQEQLLWDEIQRRAHMSRSDAGEVPDENHSQH